MSLPARRKRGQQTVYTEEIAEEILGRLADGESLNSICYDSYMPARSTVLLWASADGSEIAPAFADKYARARLLGIEVLAEELLAISDADCTVNGLPDNAIVQKQRLQVDSRKWLLSKLLPRTYGDKVTTEITGDPDQPLVTRIELVAVRSTHRDAIEREPNDGDC